MRGKTTLTCRSTSQYLDQRLCSNSGRAEINYFSPSRSTRRNLSRLGGSIKICCTTGRDLKCTDTDCEAQFPTLLVRYSQSLELTSPHIHLNSSSYLHSTMANAASNNTWGAFPTSPRGLVDLDPVEEFEFGHDLGENEAWPTNENSNEAPETNRTIPNQPCYCMVINGYMNEIRGSSKGILREVRCLRGDVEKGLASLRGDVDEALTSLRGDVDEAVASLRVDVDEALASLRGDVDKVLTSGKAVEDWIPRLFQYQSGLRDTLKQVLEHAHPGVGITSPDDPSFPASAYPAVMPSNLRNPPPNLRNPPPNPKNLLPNPRNLLPNPRNLPPPRNPLLNPEVRLRGAHY